MTNETPRSGWGWRLIRRTVLQVVLLLALYVLSVGPLYWEIYAAFYLNGAPWLARLYLPLILAYEHSEWVRAFLDWYIGLWVL